MTTKSSTASGGLYTYLVLPIGPILRVKDAKGQEELRTLVTLTRNDGSSRSHTLVVRNTDLRPDLVQHAETALNRKQPVRMVVKFERTTTLRGNAPSLATLAIAEAILDGARPATPVDSRQLNLFG